MTASLPPRCQAPHVARREEYTEISWHTPREDRSRVREHTCDCRETIYELCQSGGLMFIRRTIRDAERRPVRVQESERWLTRQAHEVWTQLLIGAAR